MPCYDSRPDTEKAEMKIRLDLATRVACTAMLLIEGGHLIEPAAWIEAVQWFKEHREADARRGDE